MRDETVDSGVTIGVIAVAGVGTLLTPSRLGGRLHGPVMLEMADDLQLLVEATEEEVNAE